MPPYKIDNLYRKMVFPISIRQDWDTRLYYLYDKVGIIIAENLNKDDAETIRDAVNNIGRTLNLLLHILELETTMIPHPDALSELIEDRIQLIESTFNYLVDLGIIEEPEIDYKEDFNQWANALLTQLTGDNSPSWAKVYHALKK